MPSCKDKKRSDALKISGITPSTWHYQLHGTVTEFMRHLGFQPWRGLSLGNPGALAFYRDLDEIAAFDAHPANFVKDEQGNVLPIDLILVRAEPALQGALARFLS